MSSTAREQSHPIGRGILVWLTAAVVLVTVAVLAVRSDRTTVYFGWIYLAAVIGSFFAVPAALLALFAYDARASRRAICLCLASIYLLAAVYLGVLGYMFVPAHHIIGDDPTRGTSQSLWEMLGDEAAYAKQYIEIDPERYASDMHWVRQTQLRYLKLWAVPAVSGLGLLLAGLTVHWRRQDSWDAG